MRGRVVLSFNRADHGQSLLHETTLRRSDLSAVGLQQAVTAEFVKMLHEGTSSRVGVSALPPSTDINVTCERRGPFGIRLKTKYMTVGITGAGNFCVLYCGN